MLISSKYVVHCISESNEKMHQRPIVFTYPTANKSFYTTTRKAKLES